jgi:ubiquinone/menaquinone biosynthesis C-methylase UbiE
MLNEIESRYTKENSNCSNLSCGSNLDFLNIAQGENILDLGCGRGNDTIQAAMLTGIEGKAVGLDITQAMIDAAHANAEGIGVSNTWFIKGDIENIPFDEAVFDAVISNCAINHAKSKKKVYSEIFRVLKKGGRFVISDAVSKNSLPEEIKNDTEAWAQCFGGAVTEEEYLAAIMSSGFTNIEIFNRREYIKNGHDFISLTIRAAKQSSGVCFECSV